MFVNPNRLINPDLRRNAEEILLEVKFDDNWRNFLICALKDIIVLRNLGPNTRNYILREAIEYEKNISTFSPSSFKRRIRELNNMLNNENLVANLLEDVNIDGPGCTANGITARFSSVELKAWFILKAPHLLNEQRHFARHIQQLIEAQNTRQAVAEQLIQMSTPR